MWWIIIFIVVFVIGRFFYDWHQQNSVIAREGGMTKKYGELIKILLSGDSRSKIYKTTGDTVTLGISSNTGGSTIFVLTHSFDDLMVQYRIDNPIFGKRKLEWKFSKYGDQKMMAEKINNDIGIFSAKLFESKMF